MNVAEKSEDSVAAEPGKADAKIKSGHQSEPTDATNSKVDKPGSDNQKTPVLSTETAKGTEELLKLTNHPKINVTIDSVEEFKKQQLLGKYFIKIGKTL